MSKLSATHFHDEAAAYAYVEARIWPNGATCPKCGERDRVSKMNGKSTRVGLYKCYVCRAPFTVKIGTVFESSHVPMNLWLQAMYLMSASKKGISSNQLHRTLGVTLKTAWFMSHRIREAMRTDGSFDFGVGGGGVEVDETFIGTDPTKPKSRSYHHKNKVLALVDRTTGQAKTAVIESLTKKEIFPIIRENVSREAKIYTDEANMYVTLRDEFAGHGVVKHKFNEYVRDDASTNTVEGFFSVFKRGMRGIYQFCAKKHLHRYVIEFEFRYNNRIALDINDTMRADKLLTGIVGKRLTYRTVGV